MATVEFRHIGMQYSGAEGTLALQNINLKISDGEFVCLIGPSGCGKSTLLGIGSGLLRQTEGEVFLDGRPQTGPTRDIGVVFQDAALFPWRTVTRNVSFGLEVAGKKGRKTAERIRRTIELVGLKGFENKYPHQLSGGMRQRAGLARTLVTDPGVIFMDEPFSAVDYLTRITLQNEIIRIWQQARKTIVFVTHDVTEAVYLATRVVLLTPRPGKIQKIYDIPFSYPRERNDPAIMNIVEQIYRAINDAGATGREPEYYL